MTCTTLRSSASILRSSASSLRSRFGRVGTAEDGSLRSTSSQSSESTSAIACLRRSSSFAVLRRMDGSCPPYTMGRRDAQAGHCAVVPTCRDDCGNLFSGHFDRRAAKGGPQRRNLLSDGSQLSYAARCLDAVYPFNYVQGRL